MLFLPTRTAPAARRRRTTSESSVGNRYSYTALAAVVRVPRMSMESLIPMGIPCNGLRSLPAACSSVNTLAWASAFSRSTVIQAFIFGFQFLIESKHASVRSTGENFFDLMPAAACFRVRELSSEGVWAEDRRGMARVPALATALAARKPRRDGFGMCCFNALRSGMSNFEASGYLRLFRKNGNNLRSRRLGPYRFGGGDGGRCLKQVGSDRGGQINSVPTPVFGPRPIMDQNGPGVLHSEVQLGCICFKPLSLRYARV